MQASLPAACAKHAYFPEGAPEQCARQFAVALAHVRPTSLHRQSQRVSAPLYALFTNPLRMSFRKNICVHLETFLHICEIDSATESLRICSTVRGKFPSWLEIGEHIKKQSGHSHSNPEGQRPHATHATLLRPFLVVPTTHVRSDAPWVPRLHCSSQPTRPLSTLLGSGPLDSETLDDLFRD